MKQMWDKKEIETLIDEHGGGGSGAKWGQITGTLSDQTDLKNALDAKQDTIDSSHKLSVSLVDGLATVATSGDYDDLINKPDQLSIDEKTIITDAETGDIKTAIGGYVIDNSIEHTTVLPFDEGYYALYNTPENTTLYNLFNSLEVNQHFDIYFEKSSDGQTWEADSHNPVDCYISSKSEDDVEVYNDDVYDNSFRATVDSIEVGWFGDFEDDTYIRMRIVIGDLEIEEIDGRVVPIDGTTITLNASNKLQGFSGNYNDLTHKPTIPAAQVNADWNASSGVAQILNKPSLATVATSGSYTDLSDKPTIPDTTYLVSTNTDQTIDANKTFAAYKQIHFNPTYYAGTVSTCDSTFTAGEVEIHNSVNGRDFYAELDCTLSPCLRLIDPTATGSRYTEYRSNGISDVYNGYFYSFPTASGRLALTSEIPTNNNQLTNGAGYQTASDVSTAISGQTKETWTFTLSDGTTTTKTIVLG